MTSGCPGTVVFKICALFNMLSHASIGTKIFHVFSPTAGKEFHEIHVLVIKHVFLIH